MGVPFKNGKSYEKPILTAITTVVIPALTVELGILIHKEFEKIREKTVTNNEENRAYIYHVAC
ncbi:hypothetical protein BH09BAC5_BH09BAC5_19290 [soil metagenome]